MENDLQVKIQQYIERTISSFHEKKLQKLQSVKLREVLKKKNPYLFRVKNVTTAEQLVRSLLDAFLSSSEETIFGDYLEQVAIFVCSESFSGQKSSTKGVDLEFTRDGIRYIVSIKSGPNWGNSSQVEKMRHDFKSAIKTLRTSNSRLDIRSVNGCCYGRDGSEDRGDYLKLCGQSFWEFISGDSYLYLNLIEPLGYQARKRNEEFETKYAAVINQFTKQLLLEFCGEDGNLDWEKLVIFNSGRQ